MGRCENLGKIVWNNEFYPNAHQGLEQLFELLGEVKRNRKASAKSPARSGRPKK